MNTNSKTDLATYKRMWNVAYDIMTHLGENTRLSHQILHTITYYTCETIAETQGPVYDVDIADTNNYFGLVPVQIMQSLYGKIVKDYKGKETIFNKDFKKSKKGNYFDIIKYLSNLIHAYLLDNHTYDNLPYRTELVHCDLVKFKKCSVNSLLYNLSSNYVDGIESINIPKAIKTLKTLCGEDLSRLRQLELSYPNYYKIKLQRENNAKNTVSQVTITAHQITLVDKAGIGTRHPIKYKQMPAHYLALWVCTRIRLIVQHKEMKYKTITNENTGYSHMRFAIEKINFYEYAERNRLEYYIHTHVLTLNLGNIIYYEPHPKDKRLLYLYIRTDHLKKVEKGEHDNYEMYDIDFTKLVKVLTQKEHTVFCSAILPHIRRYLSNNENYNTFEIDVNKVLKDLGHDEITKWERNKINNIIKKVLDTLKQDIIPSPKAYDLTYSMHEKIFIVELKSEYEYFKPNVNDLKTINITDFMQEQLRKTHRKQLKKVTKALRLKGRS